MRLSGQPELIAVAVALLRGDYERQLKTSFAMPLRLFTLAHASKFANIRIYMRVYTSGAFININNLRKLFFLACFTYC